MARLFMAGKINEEIYDQLRGEWQEKARNLQAMVKELTFDAIRYLDDLEVALTLLSKISVLYERLKEKERTTLLQVLVKRIIIDREGEIIDHELNSPFTYLSTLAAQFGRKEGGRSTTVSVSTPAATRTPASASGGQRSIH